MPIPPALLRRFYIEGSLRNRPNGFELTLRNRLAPATILTLGPLSVDGRLYAEDNFLLQTRKSTRPANRIAPEFPFDWPVNADIILIGIGPCLMAGTHDLVVQLTLRQTGKTTLTITDTLAPPTSA